MRLLKQLFENNREWARIKKQEDPKFFERMTASQNPKFLWIGCSDSRVPANEIIGLAPGDLFCHRNIANVVPHTDMNCLSVIQYAVEILKVKHVIVCGHYGCGGVKAALAGGQLGLIDNWLRHVKDVHERNKDVLEKIESIEERYDLLCELNVKAQVLNVCHTTIIQNAWKAGQEIAVHGWMYCLHDGLVRDLNLCISGRDQLQAIYRVD